MCVWRTPTARRTPSRSCSRADPCRGPAPGPSALRPCCETSSFVALAAARRGHGTSIGKGRQGACRPRLDRYENGCAPRQGAGGHTRLSSWDRRSVEADRDDGLVEADRRQVGDVPVDDLGPARAVATRPDLQRAEGRDGGGNARTGQVLAPVAGHALRGAVVAEVGLVEEDGAGGGRSGSVTGARVS